MNTYVQLKTKVYDNGDKLELYLSDGEFSQPLGKLTYYAVTYLERIEDDIAEYYTNNTQYFSLFDLDQAVLAFEERVNSQFPSKASKSRYGSLELVKERNEKFLNKPLLHELYREHGCMFLSEVNRDI